MEYHEFEKEVSTLRLQISDMGSLVEHAVMVSLRALEQNDLIACSIVIEADRQINHQQTTLEALSFRLLAFQQQFGGADLLFLTSAFTITNELERLGDGAKGIALLLLRMSSFQNQTNSLQLPFERNSNPLPASTSQEEEVRRNLLALGREMQAILRETLEAFAHQDGNRANQIAASDDHIDRDYQQITHQLMSMLTAAHAIPALQQDSRYLQRLTYFLWIAHKLERMADHCTNICERIISRTDTALPTRPESSEQT